MSLQRSIWYRSEQYAKVSLGTASKLSSVGFGVNSRETLPTALCCLSSSGSSFPTVKQVLWSTWPHLPNVVLKTKGLEVTSTKPYDTKRVLGTWQLFVPLRFEPAQYVSLWVSALHGKQILSNIHKASQQLCSFKWGLPGNRMTSTKWFFWNLQPLRRKGRGGFGEQIVFWSCPHGTLRDGSLPSFWALTLERSYHCGFCLCNGHLEWLQCAFHVWKQLCLKDVLVKGGFESRKGMRGWRDRDEICASRNRGKALVESTPLFHRHFHLVLRAAFTLTILGFITSRIWTMSISLSFKTLYCCIFIVQKQWFQS